MGGTEEGGKKRVEGGKEDKQKVAVYLVSITCMWGVGCRDLGV